MYLWAGESELASRLEERLYDTFNGCLQTDWLLSTVAFPGRSIFWDASNAKVDQLRQEA